jgi:hypothetical protein
MNNTNNKDLQRMEIEAATFRRLLAHFQANPNVQNIDLMNLADFCRNCLSKWYVAEAEKCGVMVDYDQARELVYGMPYEQYKDQHQKPATAEQMAAFNAREQK